MTALLLTIVLVLGVFVGLVLVGRRSRLLFRDPSALSDAQLDRMIEVTQAIVAKSRPGSATWVDAAQRNKAAIDERLRRRGEEGFGDIEILAPDPGQR